MQTPIVQFGTSRFLQAHVDLFVSEALARGEAMGRITVVQTTNSPDSAARVAAFNAGPFPVLIRGLTEGGVVDRRVAVSSVARAFSAAADWAAVEAAVVDEARALVSNTGDRGYDLDASDTVDTPVPHSFPAKLCRLLHARWRHRAEPLDIYPCELVSGNGDALRGIVVALARRWGHEPAFVAWLEQRCRWVNSLVDRIVSEPLFPVGAVAEPYALWAIGAAPGLVPICVHPDVVMTGDLAQYERLKLLILNLGHTYLAARWLADRRAADETVRQALEDRGLRADLDAVYDQEVLPVFAAMGMGEAASAYRRVTMERFANPFLDHRIADIAGNHAMKLQRRFRLLLDLADRHGVPGQPRLRAVLAAA